MRKCNECCATVSETSSATFRCNLRIVYFCQDFLSSNRYIKQTLEFYQFLYAMDRRLCILLGIVEPNNMRKLLLPHVLQNKEITCATSPSIV